MSLSYHYVFSAPAETPSATLEQFLRSVEAEAKAMGFHPTLVLNAEFATEQQKQFARRLTSGYRFEDERLKGVTLDQHHVWGGDPVRGSCRLILERGVVLVVTEERGCETVFGFFAYPKELHDNNDQVVLTAAVDRWFFRDFVDSPDPRFRKIVRRFAGRASWNRSRTSGRERPGTGHGRVPFL